MTKSTITRERIQQIFLGNGPEPSASEERELARMALAAMDGEPDCKERKLFCSTDTARMRKVISVSAGTEDAPLYRHPQPAPVVPENCVTAEHRRVIEMLLSVCGAAFELADDSCQQDVGGEDCHVVPDDAFQKLSDALDEIENTLPTEDIDRPDVFLAWSAMPRAALKSLLQAQPAPVVPDEKDKTVDADDHPLLWSFNEGWNACRAAMLAATKHDTHALNSVQSVVTVPGSWIPVSERMPLTPSADCEYSDIEVNVFDGERVFTAHYATGSQPEPWGYWIDTYAKITHWIHIPAAHQE